MEFNTKFEEYKEMVENYLQSTLVNKNGRIYDAMRYSLLGGGKRIRPILSLACSKALDGSMESALVLGSSIEMIHTYSLIHDDLPCMDNDDFRRGIPTCHKAFDEATATLAGDALLNFACETVVFSSLDDYKKSKGLQIIFRASGSEGMIGGQVLDMHYETYKPDINELETMHRKKTGALINAAASVGALAAGENEDFFKEYSASIGLAFQIRDDILDVEGDFLKFGKPINSDEKNNKTTFVTLHGIDNAKKMLKDETEKAVSSIAFLGEKANFLTEFALYLNNRES